MSRQIRRGAVLAPIVFMALAGCDGPDGVARVTGTVTLDGQPLANARVDFTPVAGKRPSTAVTDAEGNYELLYTMTDKGAEVGEHEVRISTRETSDGGVDSPERVPARYNTRTTMVVTVESGSNDIPLPLTSDGPIDPARVPKK